MQTLLEVLGYRTDDLMSAAAQLSLMVLQLVLIDRRRLHAGNSALPPVSDSPDALEIPCRSLKPGVGPFLIFLRRTCEQDEQTQRISTVDVDHLDRIHCVLPGLRHFFNAPSNHLATANDAGLLLGDLLGKQPLVLGTVVRF